MKKVILFASAAFVMLLMACGTAKIVSQQDMTTSIGVQTIPRDAKVYVDGKLVSTTTPTSLTIPKMVWARTNTNKQKTIIEEDNTFNIQIIKEGYEMINDVVKPKVNFEGMSTLAVLSWPENLIYELKERRADTYTDAYVKDPTIPAGAAQERVTRDTSGNTALERTIIRWYFDSAPQGARIFWRVISSVPAEVKNTNELWLGSTPFEETRAFNIQGLTYENSRDVQIEIKVKRKGYVDQSKRFNVRQAIDQQEISSFFDLVEE